MSAKSRWIILSLAVIGLAFASYSAFVHYKLLTDATYQSPCDINATFSCSQAVTVPGCSALRVAADGTNLVGAYVASGTLFFQQNFSSGSPTNVGPIDDVDAMVPTVVGSTPFRVVWRGGGAIRTDTFPIRGAAVTTLDASAFGTSPGTAGFDAVADDPSETGYAVVYSRPSTPATIHFLHNCR